MEAKLFGRTGDEEAEVAFTEVIEWAAEHGVGMEFIEITSGLLKETGIDDIVTLWISADDGTTRTATGLAEVLNLVMP